MAIQVTHTTVATGTDAGNGEIRKAQWNEAHAISLDTNKLLGRSTAGTGAAEEISIGSGLTLAAGTLSASGGGGGLTGFTAAESTAAPNATVYVDSLTASAASTNADVAFVAKGTGATLAQVPDSTTAGGNKRGTYATDWQKVRSAATQVASGNSSALIGGINNTASGTNAVAIGGQNCTSSSNHSFVSGNSNTASGPAAFVAGGTSNTASGGSSFVTGDANQASNGGAAVLGGSSNTANGSSSAIIGGQSATTRLIITNRTFGSSSNVVGGFSGSVQAGLLIIGRQTTDATATVLTSNTSAGSTTNQVILPNNSAYTFQGTCIAAKTAAGDTSSWKFEGAIKRGANAASTTLVAAVTPTVIAQDAGASAWVLAITADTTNGGIKVEVTGQAATTIRWVVKIETTEVTF